MTTSAAPELEIAVDVLFAGFGSGVALLIVAVLLTVPESVGEVCTTRVMVCAVNDASEGRVQTTVPVVPTGGVVHEKTDGLIDTNVVFAGSVSLIVTDNASLGPL